MNVYRSPSAIIAEFQITEPHEIDIEAIAHFYGATIVYEPLSGCAARILGDGKEAIITVDNSVRSSIGRKRFSAAHEFGHWMRDRQKLRFYCTDQALQNSWQNIDAERGANDYAAELLMPKTIFGPLAKNKPLTLDTAEELSALFRTSLTASAIQLLRQGSFPGMLIYTVNGKRKWFMRGEDVPDMLWPHEELRAATYAGDLAKRFLDISASGFVQADAWISHQRSRWYEVFEHSVRLSRGDILSLIWWKDERQLLDLSRDED